MTARTNSLVAHEFAGPSHKSLCLWTALPPVIPTATGQVCFIHKEHFEAQKNNFALIK